MSETIEELQKKLAEAKKLQEDTSKALLVKQRETFWSDVREKLHNRSYLRGDIDANCIVYVNYKVDSAGKDRDPKVSSREIHIFSPRRSRWPDYYGFNVAPGWPLLKAEEPGSLSEILANHQREISNERFEILLATARRLSTILTDRFIREEGGVSELLEPDPVLTNWPMDIPHAVIPMHIAHWLTGPYLTCGNIYLWSDNSRKYARECLRMGRETVMDVNLANQRDAAFRTIEGILNL